MGTPGPWPGGQRLRECFGAQEKEAYNKLGDVQSQPPITATQSPTNGQGQRFCVDTNLALQYCMFSSRSGATLSTWVMVLPEEGKRDLFHDQMTVREVQNEFDLGVSGELQASS